MIYTLASLQTRRSIAMQDGDMAAYWAFDLLIGHMLGEADMYISHNQALVASIDPHDADPYGMHEEQRRHP
jgi:hypothetical protein